MKKIIMLLMLLVSLATADAKCDWSKVNLGKSNKCNVYTFEVSGTVDTCYKHEILIFKKGSTTPIYKGTNRVFTYTFNDTGYYYVRAAIKNTCCGGDTVIYNLTHVECKPNTTVKCNWSKIGLGYSNKCGTVTFELGSKDTCITGYSLWAYNQSTHKLDTLAHDRVFKRTLDTGWYTFKASFHNKCGNCDTFIYKEIYIGCDSIMVGLNPLNRDVIKVTPNPTDDRVLVCLTYPTKQPILPYFIYNGSGQFISAGSISTCVQLTTSSWKNGVYTFRSGNVIQRIVVQH
jgi:hypothetical protein